MGNCEWCCLEQPGAAAWLSSSGSNRQSRNTKYLQEGLKLLISPTDMNKYSLRIYSIYLQSFLVKNKGKCTALYALQFPHCERKPFPWFERRFLSGPLLFRLLSECGSVVWGEPCSAARRGGRACTQGGWSGPVTLFLKTWVHFFNCFFCFPADV